MYNHLSQYNPIAHTFQRVDKQGTDEAKKAYHENWTGRGGSTGATFSHSLLTLTREHKITHIRLVLTASSTYNA